MPALKELTIDYENIKYYKSGDFAKSKEAYDMIGLLMRQLGCMNKSSYRSNITTASISSALNTYKNLLHLAENPKLIRGNNLE
jgi:hypothetical protein